MLSGIEVSGPLEFPLELLKPYIKYLAFHPYRPIHVPLKTVQITKSGSGSTRFVILFDLRLKPLFVLVDKSKFKNGKVHFRNSVGGEGGGVKD